ncbi:MAG: DUF1738 domain-containing protein [Planctomycetes bacterium]|nr:DUF1738 domain-containing protein [Planctomycetota bacterium]
MDQQSTDIYSRVTNQIIEAIEQGTQRCRLPWHITGAPIFQPTNALSKRGYRGVNLLSLWAIAQAKHYASGLWGTYRQWAQLGAQVRQGEKAALIVLWKLDEREPEPQQGEAEGEQRRVLLARGYSVFNAAQVDGYTVPETPQLSEHERIAQAEKFFAGVGVVVRHGGAEACYDVNQDLVWMPEYASFRNAVSYYSTLAHETTHWTGARSRLNRDLGERFGSDAYAMEELVAELGAAFVCSTLGLAVEPRPDHAAYIASWVRILKSDKKAIFTAASKAQQATDWMLQRADADRAAA